MSVRSEKQTGCLGKIEPEDQRKAVSSAVISHMTLYK